MCVVAYRGSQLKENRADFAFSIGNCSFARLRYLSILRLSLQATVMAERNMMVKTAESVVIFSSWKIRKAEEFVSTFKIYRRLKGTCEMNEMEVKCTLGKNSTSQIVQSVQCEARASLLD